MSVDPRVRVRDAIRRLGGFTVDELARELPGLPRATIRGILADYERAGALKVQRVRGQKRYAYCRPRGGTQARPRHKPPEALVVDRRGRGRPVPGTGRPDRPTDREVADLLEEVTRAGGVIERRRRHWLVSYAGEVIATVPSTPSDYRALRNARAGIRRGGLPLGEGLYSRNQPEPT